MDKNKIAVDIFNKYASDYQTKFMDVNLYADSFLFFCNHIPQNAEILELACGPGNITSHLLHLRPDFKILGTDLAPNMIALAKINNPSAEFQLMDCRDLLKLNKTYNAIMAGFCLPYLNKEETLQLIEDSAKILKPKGILYISTMEDDYENSGFKKGSKGDEIFMHFYTAEYLTLSIEKHNFKILELSRKISTMANGTEVVDLIIIAEK